MHETRIPDVRFYFFQFSCLSSTQIFILVFPQDEVDADFRVVMLHLSDWSPSGEASFGVGEVFGRPQFVMVFGFACHRDALLGLEFYAALK